MNGLSWFLKWKYDTMILFCSRTQFSNQIINLGAASNLWTIEYAQINLSEIFTLFLIINEPNPWITTLPDFRLVSKNLGNIRWFLTSSFMILTNKNPWCNLLRGVTKSGDATTLPIFIFHMPDLKNPFNSNTEILISDCLWQRQN